MYIARAIGAAKANVTGPPAAPKAKIIVAPSPQLSSPPFTFFISSTLNVLLHFI